MSKSLRLFTRLAQTHKPECIMALDGPLPEAVPAPEELARTLGSEALAKYAADCRPIYDDLRRIVGQLAGLTILARLTTRQEIRDLPELHKCETRWKEAFERLSTLEAPSGAGSHKSQLEAALSFCWAAMRTFSELHGQGALENALDQAGVQVKRAYAHLQAASSQKAGLDMVDFSHSCCCCSQGV